MGDEEMTFTLAETAPDLRRGDQGPWVRYLQQLLEAIDRRMTAMDFDIGTIDDDFGPRTERAVKAYQAWMPVAQTGVVDQALWSQLIEHAQAVEQIDNSEAERFGTDAGRHELDDADAVGHRGWKRVELDCSVKQFKGRAFRDSAALIRVQDDDGVVSDTYARIHAGRIIESELWVPKAGFFYLDVDSDQPGPYGRRGSVSGFTHYDSGSATRLRFEATQQDGEQGSFSFEEATERGWVQGGELESGLDLEVLTIGSKVSGESSEGHTVTEGSVITVEFPGTAFEIEQQ